MPHLDLRGARLFYTDDGRGEPPIVFVHGFSCDSHDWSWQLPYFGRTHRVIAYDQRGHGSSSAPSSGYDVPSLVADLGAFIDAVVGAPVVVVGHSLGGAVATSLAATRPDLVLAVVAVDPGHLVPDAAGPGIAAAAARYADLAQDPGDVAATAFDGASHVDATPDFLRAWHNRRAAAVPAHVLRQTMAGLIGGDHPYLLRSNCEPSLRDVDRPVLSFYVDPDRSEVATAVLDHPSSRVICHEGAGHWLHQERPEDVNVAIAAWLATTGLHED